MKHIKFKNLIVISTIFLSFSSCLKQEDPNLVREDKIGGCADIDSPSYSSTIDYINQDCVYAYTSKYIVNYFNLKPNGDKWDECAVSSGYKHADIFFRIKEFGANEWAFESTVSEDANHTGGASWIAPKALKLLNKNYVYELIDEDFSSAITVCDWDIGNDLIASGVFNPIENAKDGVVTIKQIIGQDSIQFKIYYDLKADI